MSVTFKASIKKNEQRKDKDAPRVADKVRAIFERYRGWEPVFLQNQ